MRRQRIHALILGGLALGLTGCGATRQALTRTEADSPLPATVSLDALHTEFAKAPQPLPVAPLRLPAGTERIVASSPNSDIRNRETSPTPTSTEKAAVQLVNHEPGKLVIAPNSRSVPEPEQTRPETDSLIRKAAAVAGAGMLHPIPSTPEDIEPASSDIPVPPCPPDALPLNLPTALAMVGGDHPAIGVAQWRVQEAYARLDRANVLWLPSIQPGFSFHRHDGNYQASNADIVDVNRNSFQFGLGAGATGAGTTPRPGLVAQFHVADAIFLPEIEEKTAWARGHAASGVLNEQLLTVAVAYLELLSAEQDLRVIEQSRERTAGLSKLTADFAATGQGLQADADRLATELRLIENRLAQARERADVAAVRLAEALSLDGCQRLVPLDLTVVPLDLVTPALDKGALVGTGLATRPELKEAQTLVAAACEEFKRQKYSPFVPSVLLGLSTGGFGGGQGSNLANVNDRYDFDALMLWEIRNLGLGEGASRRAASAQVEQAKFEAVRTMDRIAREISEAHAQVVHRSERMDITQAAIDSAQKSYERNLSRIRDGQGLPLEVLQSVRALEDAQRAYLEAVVDYNIAQFRLQWALGWPVCA
ncbi:MAG: TolC family protein [Planctomycetaceae bacterium]|nr:TolC family protein [Planctomycetaceae bacterium]